MSRAPENLKEPPVDTQDRDARSSDERAERAALLSLLRLLTQEPPHEHNFETCAICKDHGITKI
jgi:hypothetical protein